MHTIAVALTVVAVLTASCATRGQVERLRTDLILLDARFREQREDANRTHGASEAASAALRRELGDLAARLAKLDTALGDNAKALASLEGKLVAVEGTAAATAASLAALETKVAAAQAVAVPPPVPPPAPKRAALPAPVATAVPAPLASPPPRDGIAPRATASSEAERAYAAALATFRAREHGQAVLDLLDFLGRYPKHSLAPAAQYWIGEAYFLQRDYRQAIVEFEKVLEHGTTNTKIPDALLRAGMAWRRLRDPERARQAWQRVVQEFPRSEAAQRARTLLDDTAAVKPR
jgi:tol-pal system protein YbgF